MKFILTKNGKINKLVERFTLLEAVNYETLEMYCSTILEFIVDQVKNADNNPGVNKQVNDNIEQIRDKANSLIIEIGADKKKIDKSKDPAVVKAFAEECVTDIEALLKLITPEEDALPKEWAKAKDIFKNLKDIANSSDFTEQKVTELREQITLLVAAVENVINKINGVSSGEDDKGTSKTASAGDFVDVLQRTYEDISKIEVLAKNKNTVLDSPAVVDMLKGLTNAAREEVLVDFIDWCKEEHDGIVGAIAKNAKVTPTRKSLTDERAAGVKWAEKYAAATNKKAFWENYFNTVWQDKADKVAIFGKAFEQECEVYGFDEKTNPFIKFLKNHFAANMPDISKETYYAIHNAVARDSIEMNKKNIVKVAELDDSYLLRHKDFFMLPGNSAAAYIEYAEQARKLNLTQLSDDLRKLTSIATKDSDEEILYNVLTYMCDHPEDLADASKTVKNTNISDLTYVVWRMLYLSEHAGDMEGTAFTSAKPSISADTKARPLTEIKDLFNDLGIEVEVTAVLTAAAKSKLTKDIEDTLSGTDRSAAAKAIIYTASITWLSAKDAMKMLQKPRELDTSNIDLSDSSKYSLPAIGGKTGPAGYTDIISTKTQLMKYATTYSKANIEELIKDFNDKGWLK